MFVVTVSNPFTFCDLDSILKIVTWSAVTHRETAKIANTCVAVMFVRFFFDKTFYIACKMSLFIIVALSNTVFTPLRISENIYKSKSLYLYFHGVLQNMFGFFKKNHTFGNGGYINPINEFQVNGMRILKTSVLMVLFLWNALSDEVFRVLNI